MNPIYEELENGVFRIILSKEFYEREAVFASIYKFSEEFVAKVEPQDLTHINIFVFKKSKVATMQELLEKFLSELVDQQLRLDIDRRTAAIRKNIYDEAFRPIQGGGQ
jgi:His-Xaa-Ser system protein HxsD